MREIALQHALDGARRILGLDVAIDLAAERGVRPETAADIDVIALDRIGVLADLDLAGEQADIADVMLRAGMMAAGEMDIDRPVEIDARLAPLRDLLGVPLGIGGRELAADIAGAGDQPGADRGRLGGQTERVDGGLRQRDLVVGDAGDQQVLPDRQPDIAVAEVGAILARPRI